MVATMNYATEMCTVAFALAAILWCAAASFSGGPQSLPLTAIPDEGGQCPRGAESLDDIMQDVSTILQDVAYRKLLGTSPEYAGSSCVEIVQQKPNCPSGNYYVLNSTGSAVQVYCEMGDVFPNSLVLTNGWVRVANLNMTDPNQQCPDSLQTITDPVRACGKSTDGPSCDSVTFATYGIQYQHVCGRARGYPFGTPDAFFLLPTGPCGIPCTNINVTYVDGLSITHGNPRQHIWTYAAGITEVASLSPPDFSCPCTGTGVSPPDFVGSNYYCESGVSAEPLDDPLWDGHDCGGDEGTCCDPPNLPWFCNYLSQPTTDDLEVRFCTNQPIDLENVFADLLELYIQDQVLLP